ncbi:MAG: helix-turn-helix domain-containing protein [Actinomadura sp.]
MKLIDEVKAARSLPPPPVARQIRETAGVSQTRIGQELGVHRVTVARWEAGGRQPRGELRAAYARLLEDLRKAVTA